MYPDTTLSRGAWVDALSLISHPAHFGQDFNWDYQLTNASGQQELLLSFTEKLSMSRRCFPSLFAVLLHGLAGSVLSSLRYSFLIAYRQRLAA